MNTCIIRVNYHQTTKLLLLLFIMVGYIIGVQDKIMEV